MKQVLGIFLVVTLIAACQTPEPLMRQPAVRTPLARPPIPALTPVFFSRSLTVNNAKDLDELTDLAGSSFGPVVTLSFTADGDELFVVHGEEGVLRRWHVRDANLLTAVKIGKVGMTAAAFAGHGRYLAIGEGKIDVTPGERIVDNRDVTWVWSTQTGKLLWQTLPITLSKGSPTNRIALSADGRWLVEASSYSIGVWNMAREKPVAATGPGGTIGEEPVLASVTAVAIDAVGEWYAYATYKGDITIRDRIAFARPEGILWQAELQDRGIPLAIAFNAARTHLVAVTTRSLVVWNLRDAPNDEALYVPRPESSLANLAFSPDDALLAVGTNNGWQIWSMYDKRLLIENKQPTYAVTFSPDGRLFAWGDASGTVHIWGVPEP